LKAFDWTESAKEKIIMLRIARFMDFVHCPVF
jgi:hypothetical protein